MTRSCSARSISASSTASMPRKRSWAIRPRSSSSIVLTFLGKTEEVAGGKLEDERFQASQIEQPVMQGLFDRGQERLGGIGALHLQQTAQRLQAAPTLLERGGIAGD